MERTPSASANWLPLPLVRVSPLPVEACTCTSCNSNTYQSARERPRDGRVLRRAHSSFTASPYTHRWTNGLGGVRSWPRLALSLATEDTKCKPYLFLHQADGCCCPAFAVTHPLVRCDCLDARHTAERHLRLQEAAQRAAHALDRSHEAMSATTT